MKIGEKFSTPAFKGITVHYGVNQRLLLGFRRRKMPFCQ